MAQPPDRPRPSQPDGQDDTVTLPRAPNASHSGTPHDTSHPTLPTGAECLTEPKSLVGQSFDDFEVLAELGRGGMGVVYKARQKSLDRTVALKILLAAHLQNAVLQARFLAEPKAAAALAHPNILTVYQIGECPFGHYCAMEYVDGQTLEAIIRNRTVPIPWAVSLLLCVTEAVHYAHTKGIIHRDLKPSNIMIDRARRPVVMDFGLAKFVEQSTALTREGEVVGTPTYMPPEQAAGDLAKMGPHSDVYSLGAILYRLLTGQPPFGEGRPVETLVKVLSPRPPPPVRDFRADVPPLLEQVCMKCLKKPPGERYPSARALALDLRRARPAPIGQAPAPPTMRTSLPSVLLVTPSTGQRMRLFGEVTVIGRAAECDIQLPALTVSERHCQILLDPVSQAVLVEDLGSAGGTQVNGQPVKRCRVKDGDRLDIGGTVFEIRLAKPKS